MKNSVGLSLSEGQWGVATLTNQTQAVMLGQQITAVAWSDQMVEVGAMALSAYNKDINIPYVLGIKFFEGLKYNKAYSLASHSVTAQELVALTMGKIVRTFPSLSGDDIHVLAVPADASSETRQSIRQAAQQASLRIDHIINLSTAAAAYYQYQLKPDEDKVFVVLYVDQKHTEYGIFRPDQNTLVVQAIESTDVGEHHLREIFLKIVQEKFRIKMGVDLRKDQYSHAELTRHFEHMCKHTPISIEVVGVELDISRTEFNDRSEDVLDKMLRPLNEILSRMMIAEQKDIDIFATGSIFKFQWTKKKLENRVRLNIVFDENNVSTTDNAITLGAAWCASRIARYGVNAISGELIPDIKPSTVPLAPMSYGVISLIFDAQSQADKEQNSILIKKGSALPAKGSYDFITHHDGQISIRCTVTATERIDMQYLQVSFLQDQDCIFNTKGVEPDTIVVDFELDTNYRLTCMFKNLRTRQIYEFEHFVGQVSSSIFERLPLRA